MPAPNIDDSTAHGWEQLTAWIEDAQATARLIAEENGCDFCNIGVDLDHDGIRWRAHVRAGTASLQHAYAPNLADALTEAIRRATWERDVNMKQLPKEAA